MEKRETGQLARKISQSARSFIAKILGDNTQYMNEIGCDHKRVFLSDQRPEATVLMCSDSRVQKSAFDKTEAHDLFIVRNIGNQLLTSEGSISYGVLQLETPVLLIIGHAACGAIKAHLDGYDDAPECVRRELDTLDIAHAKSVKSGVVNNLHHQVELAMSKFTDRVDDGRLTVVGCVYDFRNDFHYGHGRLIIANVNGERDEVLISRAIGMDGSNGYRFGISHDLYNLSLCDDDPGE